jgi:sugar phosphate isomerase/epimerase
VSAGACGLWPDPLRSSDEPFFARQRLPIGLQLYTIEPELDADFDGALRAVGRLGYRIVELAGLHGRSAAQVRDALRAAVLACRSMHVQSDAPPSAPGLSGDLGAVVEDAHTLAATDIVMPSLHRSEELTAPAGTTRVLTGDDYRRNADFLNVTARALRAHGLNLSYHNHNFEFAPLAGAGTGLDILLRETDARLVSFELDAGWAAAAGVDPAALLRTHPGRFTQMHVKDIKASTQRNFASRLDGTEVGSGVLDWKVILPVAYQAGVRGFYVEQEAPFAGSRLDSVAASYRYLASLRI